jgi:hypothetical protein
MTLSIKTPSIKGMLVTRSKNDIQHKQHSLNAILLNVLFTYHYAECHYGQCHYAKCRNAECLYAECRGAV